ncbi:MAG TPA: hypothetical protein VIY47_02555 [Ignavibacteriaceae bacterium]
MFRKLFRRLIRWANTETIEAEPYLTSTKATGASASHTISEQNPGLNFSVYSANGGKVIQVYSYDRKTDRTTSNLHIVTDKEDLGEELALIITQEMLSR